MLTALTWTDFKPRFLNHAQRFGLAGTALLTGREPTFELPDIKELVYPIMLDEVRDRDGNPEYDNDGSVKVKARRKYTEDEAGRVSFTEDVKTGPQ